jgi:hypothetical protein
MNKIIYTLILFFIFLNIGWSQNATNNKKGKSYQVWISQIDSNQKLKGYLYKIGKDSITIKSSSINKRAEINYNYIRIENLNTIELRKKGKVYRGFILGGVIGFCTGGLLGLAGGDDDPDDFWAFKAEEKALIFGTLLALPGTVIGGIAGAVKIKIPIRGSKTKFEQEKPNLEFYLVE